MSAFLHALGSSLDCNHNTHTINVSVNRLYIILTCLTLCFLAIILRLLDLTFTNLEDVHRIVFNTHDTNIYHAKRANILDRNGVIIATNIPTSSLYAHPKQILDHQEAAKSIASILGTTTYKPLLQKLRSGKNFIWIKRHIIPEEQQKIHDLGIPGIYFVRDERRLYPHSNLFSHVVGYVDIDGNGVSGIEFSQNNTLSNEKDVKLTLDTRIQYITKTNLKRTVHMHQALGGAVVVMDAKNGDILSLVSYPDFNPHNVTAAKTEALFNRATLSVEERGSVLKALTFAIAIDIGKLKVSDVFNVSHPLKLGQFFVHDYHGKGGYLSMPEVLMYSSNIGVGQIAQRIGINNQKMYMHKAEMLQPTDIGLPEVGRPIYPSDANWSTISLITISYGHGIAITPIHVAQMFSTIVNGGVLHKPSVISGYSSINGRRVFSPSTSNIMRKLLRLVCTKGYGKKAEVEGYLVAGKTGTAEKITSKGTYSKSQNVAIFVAAFPANDPEYVVVAVIDEPKPNKMNHGFPTGGMVAAPLVGEIIRDIGNILQIKYQDETNPTVQNALYLHYTPRYQVKH